MPHAKQASKRKQRSKVIKAAPVLGAAGLSLLLAVGASATTGGAPADMPARNTAPDHEITLGEEEISDVSLATFYVFDKERTAPTRSGIRLASACGGCGGGCGGCGCWTGTNYTTSLFGNNAGPPHHGSEAKHKHSSNRTSVPKNP
jgi:hypothetical protein